MEESENIQDVEVHIELNYLILGVKWLLFVQDKESSVYMKEKAI